MTKPPWKTSEAKKLLYMDILSGDVYETQPKEEIYRSRPEYAEYDFQNFKVNLRNLRASMKKKQEAAEIGTNAFHHDMRIQPSLLRRDGLFWPDSAALKLLKEDIDSGVQATLSSREFWESRDEYKEFTFPYFSSHVRQELRGRRERAYWMFQKKKK